MIEFLKGTVTPKDWIINGGIVALTVALAVLFVFLFLLPKQLGMASLDEEISKQEEQLKLAKTTSDNIADLRTEAEKMQGLVKVFEERLPKEHEIPGLMQTFESLGKQVNVQVILNPRPKLSDQEKETLPYDVNAVGSFKQIVSFIIKLERYQRYFKISELEILQTKDNPKLQNAKFVLSTFRFIEQAPDEEKDKKDETKEDAKK